MAPLGHNELNGLIALHQTGDISVPLTNDDYSNALNSLRPSDAYTCQKPNLPLVQIIACRLFGAKPLYEPMLEYHSLDPWEQPSMKF